MLNVTKLILVFLALFGGQYIIKNFSEIAYSTPQKQYNNSCFIKRYVFDIGSGSTKAGGSIIDICNNKIVKTLEERRVSSEYQKCIDSAVDGVISQQCIHNGVDAIKQIKKFYKTNCRDDLCIGIATAWARTAKNTDKVIEALEQEGVIIETISQHAEGSLAFKATSAALKKTDLDEQNILVLDIGGGSAQLTGMHFNEIKVHKSPYGMYNFHDMLFDKFDIKNGCLTEKQLLMLIEYSNKLIKESFDLNTWIKCKIANRNIKVYANGTFFQLGIKRQLEFGGVLKKDALLDTLYGFCQNTLKTAQYNYPKTPKEIVPYIQTSLIMLYSIMEAAEIDEIKIVEFDNVSYLAQNIDYVKSIKDLLE